MLIAYRTCKKVEKECIWVKYLIYAALLRVHKKMVFSKSDRRLVVYYAGGGVSYSHTCHVKDTNKSLARFTDNGSVAFCQC